MKKLLFILLLSFTCSSIYAQIKPWTFGQQEIANGESYDYYIDEIPGAVSYEWSIEGPSTVILSFPWAPWDPKVVAMAFSRSGQWTLYCTVTMGDNSVQVYDYLIGVSDN